MYVPPLVITGMHRSGTSATARLLQAAGLDIGSRLLAPTLDNVLGYYEDLDFCDLCLTLVAAGVGDDPALQPDWAHGERIEVSRLAPYADRTRALIDERANRGVPWGFKEPRAAVLLDFFDAIAPDARYLFVHRPPWDVLSSLMASLYRPLQGRPALALRAWGTYNERLLRFREAHPGRTVLVSVDAVARGPAAVVTLVQGQADPRVTALAPEAVDGAFEPALLHRADPRGALAELVRADHPEVVDIHERLLASSDLADDGLVATSMPIETAVDVEERDAHLPVAAVLAGTGAHGLERARRIARPVDQTDPAGAADRGVAALPDDLVVVLFAGQMWDHALAAATARMVEDPGLGALQLAGGEAGGPAVDHDPLALVEPTPAILVRRSIWLAVGGFSGVPREPGYEAWSFAVACVARGVRTARLSGAISDLGEPPSGDRTVRRRVLAAHPALAVRLMERAEASEPQRCL